MQEKPPKARNRGKWSFAVDRGGTFTDIVGFAPDGSTRTLKLLSSSNRYEDAGIAGIRQLLGLPSGDSLDKSQISVIRIGTTVATNALLEGKIADTALAATAGFEELLEIGEGTRRDLFRLAVEKPAQLYKSVIAIRETTAADGTILSALDEDEARKSLQTLYEKGGRNIAIALRHAWKNPVHERRLGEIARDCGFEQVHLSHEVIPLIGLLKRTRTTLLEGCLSPVLFAYLATLRRLAGNVPIELMQSSGGLTPLSSIKARDTILSGPAGGVAGFSAIAIKLGHKQSIGFDMGGTSTDVSRFEGTYEHRFECEVDGIAFHADMLDIETVAAGGGSLLTFEGERLRVGPQSAGADPGPACYGLGGPLTITDANLVLGRILPECMPRTFGPGRDAPLCPDAAREALAALANEIFLATGRSYGPEELAAGFLCIANDTMGRAMKKISVSRGYDIRSHALVAFGGAASQHACEIASLLGIKTIIIPRHASVLSAYGIAMADRLERAAEAVMEPLSDRLLTRLLGKAHEQSRILAATLSGDEAAEATLYLDLRPQGTDTWLSVQAGSGGPGSASFEPAERIRHRFRETYRTRYGFEAGTEELETVNLRIEVRIPSAHHATSLSSDTSKGKPATFLQRRVWCTDGFREVPVYDLERLGQGATIHGPAMLADHQTTLFVQEGFRSNIDSEGNIILTPSAETRTTRTQTTSTETPDPVILEVFNNLFMNIAEQMGQTLENTAHSVNMKERRDFSCALFDDAGRLVSNAPHIPVHLGAMEASVQHLVEKHASAMRPGDAWLANNPHAGGSHLPDMTLISPVFLDEGRPSFYVANRGHHADIGGITPGSMPPSSRTIEEEGIVIDSFLLVRDGNFHDKETTALLSRGPWPARNLPERLSDLRAQVAANNRGREEIMRMVDSWDKATVRAYMEHIRANARHAISKALMRIAGSEGLFEASFSDTLDNGTPICVQVRVQADRDGARAKIDFTGTGGEDPGNLNAPPAVTRAAVLYVLRSLIDEEIPLNSGCLERIEIIIPEGTILSPSPQAAVAMGNVETSQRVVDVLLGAFGAAAASQGTMNNVLFAKADGSGSQYYETIPGGSGATPGHCGASGIQVHMTNTRITDPEILEHRFPQVRLAGFGLRKMSGGQGRWSGGEGVERRLLFLEPMHLSVISERRRTRPFGLMGGEAGAAGINTLIDAEGKEQELGGRIERIMQPGETLRIRTPGGGGWGPPNPP